MKLVYVCDGVASVYESQVLELLRFLAKKTDVLLIQGFHSNKEKIILKEKLSKYPELKVAWVRTFGYYPFLMHRSYNSFLRVLKKIPFQDTVFHIRGELVGYIFKRMAREKYPSMKILIDIRGIVLEEIAYKLLYVHGFRKILFKILQKYVSHVSHELFNGDNCQIYLTCVSSCMVDYIKHNYPNCNYTMLVHPNIAGEQFSYSETKRKEIRRKFNIADDELLAICSTGGNSVWQEDQLLIPYLIDAGIRVIHLSKKDFHIPGCITTTVPFQDMPAMLSAADIGVLWRKKVFINESASPSKFSEFARMGLYIIHNGSVKNAIEYIKTNKSGCIIDEVFDFEKKLIPENLIEQRRNLCRKGLETYGLTNIGNSYLRTYKHLIEESNKNDYEVI